MPAPYNNRATAASKAPAGLVAPVRLGGRFRMERLLGSGGFGEVYHATKISTGEAVAVKLEKMSDRCSFLEQEADVMREIQKCPTSDGLPAISHIRCLGKEKTYRIMIMTLMGPSLEDIHEKRLRFSLKTTLMIGMQVVSRLEFIHSTGYIHRDLKPDNFVLGLGEHKNRIHMIDFGLSTRYISCDGKHRKEETTKGFVGTARYASARTHKRIKQSRRDDIEQLVYVMIYLYRGRLPWSGLQILDSNEKERKVGEMKNCLSVAEICEGCPTSFHAALRHARDLKFSQAPSYDTLREWLLQDLVEAGETCDYIFDWDTDAKRTNSPQATGTGLESGSGATERLPTLRAAQDHPATPPRPPTLPTASTPADDANRTCGTTRVWSMQTAEGMGNSTSRGATVPKLQTTACASSREMITPSSTPQSHGITSLVSGPQSGR